MSVATAREVVRRRRADYLKAETRAEQARILDELVGLTGYHRKSLVRLLSGPDAAKPPSRPPGRTSTYALALPLLRKLWAASFFACGKRLETFLPDLMGLLVAAGEIKVTPFEEKLLRSVSSATIDRLPAADRSPKLRGLSTTKAGALLRSQIPIRTFADWTEQEAGFLEVDLVAHCGDTTRGEYLSALTMTDVMTGWTVLVPMKGKGQQGTVAALEMARKQFPFPVKGIDCDNGSEFINAHLVKYCAARQIIFTRSRPYKKNDQCHVEERNGSVVRQFVGYQRLESDEELALLRLIEVRVNRYHNYYWPMMRLLCKERQGSKVRKVYDTPKTPYQRLLALGDVAADVTKARLAQEYADPAQNPAALLRAITDLLEKLGEK
ncbi:MAG: transposase family protein [Armatimonadetes bacterium]|nr:transposase family protein [Armatimonadota bacterium]